MARGAVVYKLARDGTRTPVVGTEPAPRDPACSINNFPVAPTDPRCPRLPYRGNEPVHCPPTWAQYRRWLAVQTVRSTS